MKKGAIVTAAAVAAVVATTSFFAWQHWRAPVRDPLDVLTQMPPDAKAVIFCDFEALKKSPFLAALYKWAPASGVDEDYRQFVQATGFHYEADLNWAGIAIVPRGQDSAVTAVADGHFDRKKIAAYALQTGTRESRDGRELFVLPVQRGSRKIKFQFLRDDRIQIASGDDGDTNFSTTQTDSDAQAWKERFRRLAGSPVFAVVREDAAVSAAFSDHAPGNLRSPQLSGLLDQLQWITVAGKPENDRLRIALEGETTSESTARQLSDVVNALLEMAQAGLNDAKTREHLAPAVREAYLEVLKSADVSRIDRGDTKGVRLMFDVTPDFLDAARGATQVPAPSAPTKRTPATGRGTIRN